MANTVDILGDDAVMDSIITRTITEIVDDNATKVGTHAFNGCSKLESANFPKATNVGAYSFSNCTALTTANFPLASKELGNSAFSGCTKLKAVNIPSATSIGQNAFSGCTSLESVVFPNATTFARHAFSGCTKLKTVDAGFTEIYVGFAENASKPCSSLDTLILRSETMCTMNASYYFNNTAIGAGTGYIYVPAALVDQYKAASVWSTYASQIRAIEDYPEITVDFNAVTEIATGQFKATSITNANFPACKTIGNSAFQSCNGLTTADFPVC